MRWRYCRTSNTSGWSAFHWSQSFDGHSAPTAWNRSITCSRDVGSDFEVPQGGPGTNVGPWVQDVRRYPQAPSLYLMKTVEAPVLSTSRGLLSSLSML